MADFIVETRHLKKAFKQVEAVKDLNLIVPAGSVYGFLGPNGAGKTTTIRLLLGLLRPDGGEATLFHQSILKERRAILQRVGALVETPSIYPHLTGRENLEVLRRMMGISPQFIDQALKTVNLEADGKRLVKGYSLGMKQRLGLAMALLGEPALLFLDEPTNGLDPAGIHEMRDLIARLPKEQGITVFLSSHLLNEVEQVATSIGIIQRGSLIFQGTPDQLQSRLEEFVSLGVDQPDHARMVLMQAGWRVTPNGNGRLIVRANGESDAALINARLVAQGINVFHVALEHPSLEDIFLRLTETSQPAGGVSKSGLSGADNRSGSRPSTASTQAPAKV